MYFGSIPVCGIGKKAYFVDWISLFLFLMKEHPSKSSLPLLLDLCGIVPHNRFSGLYFFAEIKMGVSIGSCSNCTMSQPFLDGFQVNAVRIQQTCTAMPENVEAYQLQIILCQDNPKMLADISWFYSVSHFISENIFQISLL